MFLINPWLNHTCEVQFVSASACVNIPEQVRTLWSSEKIRFELKSLLFGDELVFAAGGAEKKLTENDLRLSLQHKVERGDKESLNSRNTLVAWMCNAKL